MSTPEKTVIFESEIKDLQDRLKLLDENDREKVLKFLLEPFCKYCFTVHLPCYCWNNS